MRELQGNDQIYKFCKALGSELRVKIVEILATQGEKNLNELAMMLHVTNGAMTSHIRLLVDAGIISVRHSSGKRGSQKTCALTNRRYLLKLEDDAVRMKSYYIDIPIGQYTNYHVQPTCGLATGESIIGELDDVRYFDSPKRVEAGILWFVEGFLEYRVPNYLRAGQRIREVQVSFEISSEAPGVNNQWPSDIAFSINGISVGVWTSPGDFGDTRGLYSPDWWPINMNQYGLLKVLSVTESGCYIDGVKISDTTIADLHLDSHSQILLRMEVQERDGRNGGLTLYGSGFGNYNQDIGVRVCYFDAEDGSN